jgi:hypothetical protein
MKSTVVALAIVLSLLCSFPSSSPRAEGPADSSQSGRTRAENYERGKALYDQRRFAEAFPFLEKAALDGHAEAQMHLGKMYFNGWGVKHDHKRAIEWHRKAAAQGNAESIEKLKKMEAGGDGH